MMQYVFGSNFNRIGQNENVPQSNNTAEASEKSASEQTAMQAESATSTPGKETKASHLAGRRMAQSQVGLAADETDPGRGQHQLKATPNRIFQRAERGVDATQGRSSNQITRTTSTIGTVRRLHSFPNKPEVRLG